MASKDGVEARGAVHESGKYRKEEGAARGQTIRTEFGRDRSDDEGADRESMMGNLKGSDDSIAHSISGGKVPSV